MKQPVLKIAGIAGAAIVVGAIIYGFYGFVSALKAINQIMDTCNEYDCDECPTQGLCGVCDKD